MTRDYEEYWSSLTASHSDHPGNRFRYDLIAHELVSRNLHPKRVLDCGCGDGSLLSVVARHLTYGELHGTDIAPNVPIQRTGLPIQFRQQDLGSPIPQELHGQFDLVLCCEVIEHVPDDSTVLENLNSLVAPGGTVVLTTQSGNIYKTEQFLGHLRHYRIVDLCARAERAGLKVEKAYLAGWPWLNLQKILAHQFQGSVQKNIVQATTLSAKVKAIFLILHRLYSISSRHRGPQIIIVATKGRPVQ
jgi:2-polyprenyl-3-methyl-5-hydroxy-6-metoxy-1,4-benzoquinol methylase